MFRLETLLLIYLAAVQIFWFGYYFFVPLREYETARTIGEYIVGVVLLPILIPLMIIAFIAGIKIRK